MTLLFLHIPKAGGTTFRKIIHRQYSDENIYTIPYQNWPFKAKKELNNMEDTISDLKLIKGHMPFGWHAEFPFIKSSYFTMMREPVKRFISHFYYEKIEGRPYHNNVKEISLEEYILNPTIKEFDNCMTRYYANCLDIPVGQLNDSHYELAKTNLKNYFSQILLMEEFDKSLVLCKKSFSWKQSILYSESNVNTKFKKSKISQERVAEIRKHLKYDVELYKFGQQVFQENWLIIKNIESDFRRFKIKNYVFQKIHPLYAKIKIFILRDILKKDLSSYV